MSNKNQSPKSSGSDPIMIFFGGAAAVAFIGYVAWSKFHAPLSNVYAGWRLFTNFLGWLFGEYIFNIPFLVKPFHDSWVFFRQTNPADILFRQWIDTSIPVNVVLLIAISIPLAIRSIRTSLRTNPLNHKNFGKAKDFTVETFMKAQEKVYPYLRLYNALNMLQQPVNEGRLRMADTPKQFVLNHGLLAPEARANNIVINAEPTARVFSEQLGSPWSGLAGLSVVEVVLFGALAPKAAATNIKMSDADYEKALDLSAKILKSCWQIFTPDASGNVPSVRELVENLKKSRVYADAMESARRYMENRVIQGIVGRHAYVCTVFYELLEIARKTGVLPSADFRWLKLVDRPLWYTLNTVGRYVAVPEVSGIYAHYLYEKSAGRATEKPMVETAVHALQEAFSKVIFSEEEWATVAEARKKARTEKNN